MDFQWVAIALGDVVWVAAAFVLGMASRSVGLPPLVGFLATGFLLSAFGIASGEVLQKFADIGITLLLFTVGLKLNLRTLAGPQVWAVTALHMWIIVVVFGLSIYGLAILGAPLVANLGLSQSLLVAFALSFSSTVYAVKVLEEKGEMYSLHGRIAIGILIVQDLAAVAFLAFSIGKWPSPWAVLLLLSFLLRPLLHWLLQQVGRGELLVLYGFLLALGGAEVFELVGLKGDLGALVFGVFIANHSKAEDLAKTMLGFKDLFLLGFFLSVGMYGHPSLESIVIALLLSPFVLFKSALFVGLLSAFKLRARSSLMTSLNLSNYSEFGLIVAAIGVVNGWLEAQWLTVLALALAFSFVIAAILGSSANDIYARLRVPLRRLQRRERLVDDHPIEIGDAKVAVIGMGGVGTGVYDKLRDVYGAAVVGIDIDPVTVKNQTATGRNVLLGDPSDADFWDRVQATHTLELVSLVLPKISTSLNVLEQLKAASFTGRVAAIARYPDEVEALKDGGALIVFNIYTEAGAGFAAHVIAEIPKYSSR